MKTLLPIKLNNILTEVVEIKTLQLQLCKFTTTNYIKTKLTQLAFYDGFQNLFKNVLVINSVNISLIVLPFLSNF